MAEDPLDNVRPPNETSTISLDGRRLTTADLYAVAARPDVTRVKIFGLAAALPGAEGHCLQPVFEATWAGPCPRCGRPRVVLTAPPPRTPRMACPVDDQPRIERHVAAWNRAQELST
jgi:hypothetical protein